MRLGIIHDLLHSLNTLLVLGRETDRRLRSTQLLLSIHQSSIGLRGEVRLLRSCQCCGGLPFSVELRMQNCTSSDLQISGDFAQCAPIIRPLLFKGFAGVVRRVILKLPQSAIVVGLNLILDVVDPQNLLSPGSCLVT